MPGLHRPLIIIFWLCSVSAVFGQDRCGTVEYNNQLRKLKRLTDDSFEQWLKDRSTTLRTANAKRQKGPPYVIPVVVHVIHKGEAVGTGSNISDAQILSQIAVLNKDFKRLNADANKTPSEFLTSAGAMDIQFVLAKRDPEGVATNGIVRVKGAKDGWTLSDNYELKAQSYWPAEDYLNLWVCDLVDDLVGYSQYPESNLPGIDNSSVNRLTDGVVIWYQAFGSSDDGNFTLSSTFNKGRTLTHELGHFFGLRHIWGDDSGSCDGDDFVNDTPKQATSSSGCPSHPKTSCGTVNMFQNFMDYTADACMNLFTKEQVTRMSTVLENSPRRVSLLSSPGLSDPVTVQRDLGIRSIVSPTSYQCSNTITPVIEIRNYGSAAITSAQIQLELNNVVVQTLDIALNLANLQTTQVTFAGLSLPSTVHTIEFTVISVNGNTDENTSNNRLALEFTVPGRTTAPFSENFTTFPTNWTIRNPDGKITWEIATAPRENATNKAIRINLFDYEESYGEVDILLSPIFDLSTASTASLTFDVAYTRYLSSNDRLRVVVLEDCQNIEEGTVIYDKVGSALRTTNATTGSFVPTGPQDWRREFTNISQFIGKSNIQLAFVGVSDWGNNMYLDNIGVLTSQMEDVELQGLESPSFITCDANPSPVLLGQNIGTQIITSLTVSYSINGTNQQFSVSNLNVPVGAEFQIPMGSIQLTAPTNVLTVTLSSPNGQVDQSPGNNTKTFTILLDQTQERIPLRQNFESGIAPWKVFSPEGGQDWQITNTNFKSSLYYNAFGNTSLNETSWLVSPVLDFSSVTEASIVFDYSYRFRTGRKEKLYLYGSKDCGNTFQEIRDITLSTEQFENAWAPTNDQEWRKDFIVDLSRYAGESNVRLAFVAVNDNGNNLFLDNIEFFTSAYPVLTPVEEPFNIYGYRVDDLKSSELQITFNLSDRQDVSYMVVDVMGKIQKQGILVDVLNQTFRLDEEKTLAAGTYIIHLRLGQGRFSERFMIAK